jgi:hypothetical protein
MRALHSSRCLLHKISPNSKEKLPPHQTLDERPSPLWAGTIDQLVVSGGILSEIVFFHRPSRTLVLTDLIENFELSPICSPWLRALLRIGGVVDPDGKSPLDMRLSLWGHRAELRNAVRTMLAWKPEHVMHGRWYDRDGDRELRRAFR